MLETLVLKKYVITNCISRYKALSSLGLPFSCWCRATGEASTFSFDCLIRNLKCRLLAHAVPRSDFIQDTTTTTTHWKESCNLDYPVISILNRCIVGFQQHISIGLSQGTSVWGSAISYSWKFPERSPPLQNIMGLPVWIMYSGRQTKEMLLKDRRSQKIQYLVRLLNNEALTHEIWLTFICSYRPVEILLSDILAESLLIWQRVRFLSVKFFLMCILKPKKC